MKSDFTVAQNLFLLFLSPVFLKQGLEDELQR